MKEKASLTVKREIAVALVPACMHALEAYQCLTFFLCSVAVDCHKDSTSSKMQTKVTTDQDQDQGVMMKLSIPMHSLTAASAAASNKSDSS